MSQVMVLSDAMLNFLIIPDEKGQPAESLVISLKELDPDFNRADSRWRN